MPLPYADLVVESIEVPAAVLTGYELAVTWTVANRGIGLTNTGRWNDDVYLGARCRRCGSSRSPWTFRSLRTTGGR